MTEKKGNAGSHHTAMEAARVLSIGRHVGILRASGVTFRSVSLAAYAVAGFLNSTELGGCHKKTLLKNPAYRALLEPLVHGDSPQFPRTIEADKFEKEVLMGRVRNLSTIVKFLQDERAGKSPEISLGSVSVDDFECVCSALERVLIHFKEFIVTDPAAGVVVDPLNKQIVAPRDVVAPFFKWLDDRRKST